MVLTTEKAIDFTRNVKILVFGELITFMLSFGLNFFIIRFLSVDEYSYLNRILVIPSILLYLTDFFSRLVNLTSASIFDIAILIPPNIVYSKELLKHYL